MERLIQFELLENGKIYSEVTPTMWWFWEKRMFDALFPLPILEKFRRWKTFHCWNSNIKEEKFAKNRCEEPT